MLCGHHETRQTLVPPVAVDRTDGDPLAVVPSSSRAGPHNRRVVSKRKRSKRDDDPLGVYRRIRKPMPPPERIVPDKRRELEDEEARREIEEER